MSKTQLSLISSQKTHPNDLLLSNHWARNRFQNSTFDQMDFASLAPTSATRATKYLSYTTRQIFDATVEIPGCRFSVVFCPKRNMKTRRIFMAKISSAFTATAVSRMIRRPLMTLSALCFNAMNAKIGSTAIASNPSWTTLTFQRNLFSSVDSASQKIMSWG